MSCQYHAKKAALTKLQQSPLFSAVLSYARRRSVFEVWVSGSEKWNHYDHELGDTPSGPKADGHYDVEGHSWTDVYGYHRLNLFRWRDLKAFAHDVAEWAKDVFRYRQWFRSPFCLTWENWVWTVESVDVLRSDMAHDDVDEKYSTPKEMMVAYDKAYADMTYDKVMARISAEGHYHQVSDGIWVSKADPTVVVVDQHRYPYDMKDGWSDSAVMRLLTLWAKELGLPVTCFVSKDRQESYSPFSARLTRIAHSFLMFHRKKDK